MAVAPPPCENGRVRPMPQEDQRMSTYAIADTSSAILAFLQGVDEGDDDPRATVANSVTKSNSTTAKPGKLVSANRTRPIESRRTR